MGVAATVLAVAATQVGDLLPSGTEGEPPGWAWVPGFLAWTAAALTALIAFLNREMLDPGIQREWVLARALAEAYKSLVFTFAVGVLRLSTDRTPRRSSRSAPSSSRAGPSASR